MELTVRAGQVPPRRARSRRRLLWAWLARTTARETVAIGVIAGLVVAAVVTAVTGLGLKRMLPARTLRNAPDAEPCRG